jgi:hypothetical protein
MASLEELQQLDGCAAIYVVEYQGECKELLCIQRKGYTAAPALQVVILSPDENTAWLQYGVEQVNVASLEMTTNPEAYIIQPGPALSKSEGHVGLLGPMGAKKLVCGNLYTIDHEPAPSELYERYKVIEIAKPYKLKTPYTHAAIERIGFPEHPDVIRKKLKAKEGREMKVYAVKLGTQKQMLLVRRLD